MSDNNNECIDNKDCTNNPEYKFCYDTKCVSCIDDSHCDDGYYCHDDIKKCVEKIEKPGSENIEDDGLPIWALMIIIVAAVIIILAVGYIAYKLKLFPINSGELSRSERSISERYQRETKNWPKAKMLDEVYHYLPSNEDEPIPSQHDLLIDENLDKKYNDMITKLDQLMIQLVIFNGNLPNSVNQLIAKNIEEINILKFNKKYGIAAKQLNDEVIQKIIDHINDTNKFEYYNKQLTSMGIENQSIEDYQKDYNQYIKARDYLSAIKILNFIEDTIEQ